LVIDAGWFKINEEWYDEQGDWNPSKELFPQGLKAVADEIRAAGMIPGLWFELEVAGNGAVSFHNTDHLLKRHGVPLTAGSRRFWDMTDPWVVDYLSGKVIDLLRDCGFGYIKIDYNDTIGIGCDGWESLGEGLRQQVYGTAAFFNRIREQIPGIVIELCSSGGHRLVPQMLELVTQASFSDAHETVYIPIIAANLHRVMLPEQSQIWAVLRASDDIRRIQYSLVNTLLGRMCLSGDIYDLNAEQWEAVDQGMAFYHQAAPIIQHGETILNHCDVENLADPHGNQLVLRQYQGQTLAVAHRFADSKPVDLSFLEGQQVLAVYGNADADFSAQAWIFTSR
jgi:alpha-galactosidase